MLFFIGDVHGFYLPIIDNINWYNINNCTLIFLGDFGIGFYPFKKDLETLTELNDLFISKNITAYIIRGNHDDPAYFNGTDFFKLSNINFVKDYAILKIDDLSILCIGGAISVDRNFRKLNKDYWLNEKINFIDFNFNEKIDIILSHTAPYFCEPVIPFPTNDIYLKKDFDQERNYLNNLYDYIYKNNLIANNFKWFYGHFHKHYNLVLNNHSFIGLAENEIYENR